MTTQIFLSRAADKSARAVLRDSTEAAHLRMHGLPPFLEIAEQRLTRTRYVKLLRALFLFHSVIAVGARRNGWAPASSSARKIDLLGTDLWNLRAYALDCIFRWDTGSPLAMLGAIYVAEGSMMGNRIVARQLDYMFGPHAKGREFFIGSGQRDIAAWRHLLGVLEARLGDNHSVGQAVEGATAAFDLFEACVGHFGLSGINEKPPLPPEARAFAFPANPAGQ